MSVLDTTSITTMIPTTKRWSSKTKEESAAHAVDSSRARSWFGREKKQLYLDELKAMLLALVDERDAVARATGTMNKSTEQAEEVEATSKTTHLGTEQAKQLSRELEEVTGTTVSLSKSKQLNKLQEKYNKKEAKFNEKKLAVVEIKAIGGSKQDDHKFI